MTSQSLLCRPELTGRSSEWSPRWSTRSCPTTNFPSSAPGWRRYAWIALYSLTDFTVGRPQPCPVRQHRARQLLRAVPQPRQRDVSAALRQTPWCLCEGGHQSRVRKSFLDLFIPLRCWRTSTKPTPSPEPPPQWLSASQLSKPKGNLRMLLHRKVNELPTQTTINIHVKICSWNKLFESWKRIGK